MWAVLASSLIHKAPCSRSFSRCRENNCSRGMHNARAERAATSMLLTIDHGAVRELQLNRPPANALSPELIVALKQAVELAPQDGARALVLSGTPGRFSAGLDVPLLLSLDRSAIATLWKEFYGLVRAIALSP